MKVRVLLIVLSVAAIWTDAALAGEITRGPYLQDVREDGVVVAWEGNHFNAPVLAFGASSVEEEAAIAVCQEPHCFVRLTGLPADSDFLYEVRDADGPLAPAGAFRTAPDWPRPFKFVVFGDNRSDNAAHSMVVDMMLAGDFDLVINTGDMVSSGEIEEQWDIFFGIEAELFRSRPFYPAVGNHEESDGAIPIVERLFHTPKEASGSGQMSYYSFDYAGGHFLVIDDFVHVAPWYLCVLLGKFYDNCFTPEQEEWIHADLEAAAANPEIEHVFVFAHEGPYSSKENRTGSAAMRELLPAFAASKVRIVFSGHDHLYEHGISGNGLHYVVTGGGGAPLYESKPDAVNQMFPHELLMVESVHNFQVVEVAGEWLKMSTWDVDNGKIMDDIELGTPPVCVSPEDCIEGEAGICEGTWDCVQLECVWICAPPPSCEVPEDCPQPDEGACPGGWECTNEGTCLWVCATEDECQGDDGCADKPPLTDCPGGAFQCMDGVCEWLCPPPVVDGAEDVVVGLDSSPEETSAVPDVLEKSDTTAPAPAPESQGSGGCAMRGGAGPEAWMLLSFFMFFMVALRRRGGLLISRRNS